MTMHVTEGARRATLVLRISRLCRSCAHALLSLNLKKKRDCLQSSDAQAQWLLHSCYLIPLSLAINYYYDNNYYQHTGPILITRSEKEKAISLKSLTIYT